MPLPLNRQPPSGESWTLVTWRKPRKKQVSHPYPNFPWGEQHKKNTCQHPKKKKKILKKTSDYTNGWHLGTETYNPDHLRGILPSKVLW